MKGPLVLLLVSAVVLAVDRVDSAATIITTNQDGSTNCDGLKCPPGNKVTCVVNSNTVNGQGVVERKCMDASGAVLLQSSYNVQSPGLTFARTSSMSVFKKN